MAGIVQIVFVKWGSAYGAAHVNGLLAAIRARTTAALRPVCITDDGAGLDPQIAQRPFPDMGMPFEWLTTRSCFGKLSMFHEGVLEPGLKTLFFDLDTAVLGDIGLLAGCLDRRRGIWMLKNHFVPTWRLRPLIRRVAPEKYYFANSSVMAFYPEDYHFIAKGFIRDYPAAKAESEAAGTPLHSAMRTDDRYVSYVARDSLRVFPSHLAARFQDTYMTFGWRMSALQDALPWVRARRARRVALTFMGGETKPRRLAGIRPGEEIRYGILKTRWNYPELQRYWAGIIASGSPEPGPAPASERELDPE